MNWDDDVNIISRPAIRLAQPIRSERACRKTFRAVEELMGRPQLSHAESELLDVLVALVEQYESIQYPTPSNPPDRMLAQRGKLAAREAFVDSPTTQGCPKRTWEHRSKMLMRTKPRTAQYRSAILRA